MTGQVVYDLTEVLLASTGKLRYYGIARVVAEIGIELFKQSKDIRFGIYSPGHGLIYEVFPSRTADGGVALNVPLGIEQFRIRQHFHERLFLRDIALKLVRPIVDRNNRKHWDERAGDLKPIDMTGKVLVSCGRPKLIVDMVAELDRKGMPCELVPLLHDMIPLHDFKHKVPSFKSNFQKDNQYIVARAKALLANSEFTKKEILVFSQQGALPPAPEIFGIPLVHECPQGTEPSEHEPPSEPYILAVGASLGRKNIEAVFSAMEILKRRGAPVPVFVLAGARRQATDDYVQSETCEKIRNNIVFVENPNQTDLVTLYEKAVALVLASRMEGWGLPAGEALWLGTPAICSTAPVLREVCGDLALYFDPDDAEALANHIQRLMTDSDFDSELRARITANRKTLRTWSHVADDVLAALRIVGSFA